jgi:hypothetical protein
MCAVRFPVQLTKSQSPTQTGRIGTFQSKQFPTFQVPPSDGADVGDFPWKQAALPIMETYAESTDGSFIEVKDSALVWHYRDADPDFGSWQVSAASLHRAPVCDCCYQPQRLSMGCFLDA